MQYKLMNVMNITLQDLCIQLYPIGLGIQMDG